MLYLLISAMPKIIRIRFYEELNDFLPGKKRKVLFDSFFRGNPTIKDIVESMGVPHTEIDLILINGESVSFDHHPANRDIVSVYPVYESFDISPIIRLRPKPLRISRFITDAHLGKLARILRMLGFDTIYNNELDDHQIIVIAENEKRIVLSRDIGLLKNGNLSRGYWLRSQDPREQIKEVIQRLDLREQILPFHRCMECNGEIDRVKKESVIDLLKPMTREHFNDFYQCRGCKKIYWQGSHYEKMLEMIIRLKG